MQLFQGLWGKSATSFFRGVVILILSAGFVCTRLCVGSWGERTVFRFPVHERSLYLALKSYVTDVFLLTCCHMISLGTECHAHVGAGTHQSPGTLPVTLLTFQWTHFAGWEPRSVALVLLCLPYAPCTSTLVICSPMLVMLTACPARYKM